MITLYRFKLSLLEPHIPMNDLHRIIDVRGDVHFFELKQAIQHYFNCTGNYTWQFIITRQKLETLDKLKAHQEFISDKTLSELKASDSFYKANSTIDTLQLELKDYLYLWLTTDNNNTELVFRIRLEKISQAPDGFASVQLIKSVGELPIQPNNNHGDIDFELSLVSALMLIATGGDGEPVRWQELVDNGVAHELVNRNLIKPCVNPMHIVKMTAYGEGELARMMKVLGIVK